METTQEYLIPPLVHSTRREFLLPLINKLYILTACLAEQRNLLYSLFFSHIAKEYEKLFIRSCSNQLELALFYNCNARTFETYNTLSVSDDILNANIETTTTGK